MGELEKAMSLRAMSFVILGSSVICTTRFPRSTRQFVQSEGIPYPRFAPYGMTRGMECPAELSTSPRLEAVSRKSSYHSSPSRCICMNSLPLKFINAWFLHVEALERGMDFLTL